MPLKEMTDITRSTPIEDAFFDSAFIASRLLAKGYKTVGQVLGIPERKKAVLFGRCMKKFIEERLKDVYDDGDIHNHTCGDARVNGHCVHEWAQEARRLMHVLRRIGKTCGEYTYSYPFHSTVSDLVGTALKNVLTEEPDT